MNRSRTPHRIRIVGWFLLTLCVNIDKPVRAADVSWIGGSDSFLADGNWSGANTPPISGDIFYFGTAGAGGLLLNNDLTHAAFQVAGIHFDPGASAFVIGDATTAANAGNSFVLTGDVTNQSASLQTVNNPFSMASARTFTTSAGGGNLNLGGNISGSGGITGAGTGTLTLSGSNSYSGETRVNGGILAIGNGASLSATSMLLVGDSGAGGVTLSGGGLINSTGIVQIGGNAVGTMSLDGAGTQLSVGNYLEVGYNTIGTLEITGGARVSSDSTVATGVLAGSNGSILITGDTGGGSPVAAKLTAVSTTYLGYLGTGSLTVESGGLYETSGGMILAQQAGSSGTLNLNAGGELRFTGSSGITQGAGAAAVNFAGGQLSIENFDFSTTVAITLSNTSTIETIGTHANMNGVLSGSGGLNLTGNGTVRLTADNTYLGDTTISSGILQLGNETASGSLVGNVTNNGTFLFKRSDDFSFDNVISGSGGVLLAGHIVRLTAAQTYAGPTQINSGATLVLPSTVDHGLAATSIVTVITGGNLDIADRAQTFGGLTGGGTLYSFNGNAGSLTLDVAAGQIHDFAGSLGGIYPNFTVTKSGSGTQILSGSNTYTGTTTVTSGMLQSTSSSALSSTVSVGVLNAGSTLAVNYGGAADYSQAEVATLFAKTTFGGPTTLFAFDTTNAIGPVSYSNALDLSAGLRKLGTGTLILTATNTYSGSTIVDFGTLQIGNGGITGSLAPGSAISNNATLVFNRTNSVVQGTDFGAISGSGEVVQQGTGSLIFTSSNAMIGNILISDGAVQLGDGGTDGSLSPTSTITNNATFILDRSDTVTQGIDFGGDIGGTGQLIQQGSGLLILNTVNAYTGGTIVNGGSLQIGDGTASALVRSGNGVNGIPGLSGTGWPDPGTAAEDAITVNSASSLTILSQSSVIAGEGGAGGIGESTHDHRSGGYGGDGARGGTGIVFNALGSLINDGEILAGKGGNGGDGGDSGGTPGWGGDGAAGGSGVVFTSGGSLTNQGTISAGAGGDLGSGGAGGAVTNEFGDHGRVGAGGVGVLFAAGGSLINSGTISAGTAGRPNQGGNGTGVFISGGAGIFTNLAGGTINGNVLMDGFVNEVTLETGSRVNGILQIALNPGSTLTLLGSGTQAYSDAVTLGTTFGGSFTKSGAGTWILDQTFSHTGTTTISEGTLKLTAALGDTAVTVESGAGLDGEGTIGSGGSLTFDSGSFLYVDINTVGALSIGGNLTLNGTVDLVLANVPTSGQTLRLLDYGGTLTGSAANLNLSNTQLRNPVISTATANQINLTFETKNLNWSGTTSAWDVNTTANWNAGADHFFQGDAVSFDDSGTIKNVVLDSAASPGSVTVSNSIGNDYTISGAGGIGGLGSLTKAGMGTLTLSTANTYTGATAINGGQLQVGNGGTTGSLSPDSAIITNNATLAFNRSNLVAQGSDFGVINGTGNVVQQGSGTVVFNSANTYSGGTTIANGTLQIGNGGATGSLTGNILNHGTLVFKRNDDYSFGGVVSGSGGVVHDGNILRFAQAQTYTGTTQINSGFLVLPTSVDNALSSSVVSIATGANLDMSNRNQQFAGLEGGGTVYSFNSSATTLTLDVAGGQTHSFSGLLGGTHPNFALTKSGAGTQILSGVNTYTGTTTITDGTLVVDGIIATSSGIFIALDAELAGHGVVGSISGAGLVAPGDPQILTATTVDPGNGLDFAFEFTLSGAPIFANVADSGNDVLHLTGATPFTFALTSANTLSLDFSGATLVAGQTYEGGFFTDAAVADSFLDGASFVYTGLNGAVMQYNGLIVQDSAAFATGTVTNGRIMQFEVLSVPEPGIGTLFLLGSLWVLLGQRKTRTTHARLR